jgi:uncharacterized protein
LKNIIVIFILSISTFAYATEVIPPAPENHFNDYAHVVSTATANKLNDELENFERETSNQIVVAVYPKMQSDSSIEDYTVRVAQKWGVGNKIKKNGAVLFVFVDDRKMFIQVGYGLEDTLTDATTKDIVEDRIKPRFKNNDYDGGLTAGVESMIAATRGEYKGTGATVEDSKQQKGFGISGVVVVIVILILISRMRRAAMYGGGGRSSLIWPILWGMSSGRSSGGSWGGG